jgi:hypothetical protein
MILFNIRCSNFALLFTDISHAGWLQSQVHFSYISLIFLSKKVAMMMSAVNMIHIFLAREDGFRLYIQYHFSFWKKKKRFTLF